MGRGPRPSPRTAALNMPTVAFEPEAEDEFEAAVAGYEQRAPSLGFAWCSPSTESSAASRFSPAPTPRSPAFRRIAVRRARVPGFPYSVAFVELETEVRVIAIAHDKRRPGYRLKRLDR